MIHKLVSITGIARIFTDLHIFLSNSLLTDNLTLLGTSSQ